MSNVLTVSSISTFLSVHSRYTACMLSLTLLMYLPVKKICYSFFVSVPTSLDTQEDLNLVTGGLHGLG